MYRRTPIGFEAGFVLQTTAAAGSGWQYVGPFRGRNMMVAAIWTGTTVGAAVRVEGAMTTSSTDPFLIAIRRSSQASASVASTSGALAKWGSYLRVKTTKGVFNTSTKYARVKVVGTVPTS